QRKSAAWPLADAGVSVRDGDSMAIELPRRQRHDICQRSERRVSEGRGDRPGALQDGDVVDEATVLVGQNCCSQELAPVEHSSPEQDCPFVVAYLIGVF